MQVDLIFNDYDICGDHTLVFRIVTNRFDGFITYSYLEENDDHPGIVVKEYFPFANRSKIYEVGYQA